MNVLQAIQFHVIQNWKSTVSGLLTATIGVSGVFLAVGITGKHVGTSSVVFVVSNVAKVLLGIVQKDPPKE